MKKLAFLGLIGVASAFATPVSYSTSGQFMSSGTNTLSNGDATIKFGGVSANVDEPTFSSLGTFIVMANGGGRFSDSFTLMITQTIPSSGKGSATTSISGSITGNSSMISVDLVPASFGIGPVSYTFAPQNYGLNNPSDNGGMTTIEAYIANPGRSVASNPEPASLGLVAVALLGFGVVSRRLIEKK